MRNQAAQQEQFAETLREQQRAERRAKLSALSGQFLALEAVGQMTPQQRGKQFEDWLGELFDVYALERTINVINPGEQIDFTFWYGEQFVIGEARWLASAVDPKQVRDFFEKLRERPPFVVGLMIAIAGFTEAALDVLRKRSGDRCVLTLDATQLRSILKRKSGSC